MSEPRGYAWSSHSHRLSFCIDGSTLQVAHDVIRLLLSSCCLSLSTVSASAALADLRMSCWRCTHAATGCLFCFCFVSYGVICVKSETSAALLCFLLFTVLQLTVQLPLLGSIFTTTPPTFGLPFIKFHTFESSVRIK